MTDVDTTAVLESKGQALGLLLNALDMPDNFKDNLAELMTELNEEELGELTDHLVLAVLAQSAREGTAEYQKGVETIDQETVKELQALLAGKSEEV